MAKKHRDYDNDYPSVTEILGVLRKIGLEMWFKHNTAAFCDEKSKRGREVGTQIHEAIQSYIETGLAKVETAYQEEVSNALKSFMSFKNSSPSIVLHRSELALTSLIHQFNGTIDCIGQIDGNPLLLDWKSSTLNKKGELDIYDEWRAQTSAYVHLYNEIFPDKAIDMAIIVVVAKDGISYLTYSLSRLEIDACFNEVFLPALKIWRFQHDKSWKIQKNRKDAETNESCSK